MIEMLGHPSFEMIIAQFEQLKCMLIENQTKI